MKKTELVVELYIVDPVKAVWSGEVKWPLPERLPSIGEKICLGDDNWTIKVDGVHWYPNADKTFAVIFATVDETELRDEAFVKKVLRESGML